MLVEGGTIWLRSRIPGSPHLYLAVLRGQLENLSNGLVNAMPKGVKKGRKPVSVLAAGTQLVAAELLYRLSGV